MNLNDNNNRYYNDYGYQNNNRQPNPYNGTNGGNFVLGLVVGIATTALVAGCAFACVKVYEAVDSRNVAKSGTADSVVNKDTEKKLAAIEDVIEEYY